VRNHRSGNLKSCINTDWHEVIHYKKLATNFTDGEDSEKPFVFLFMCL